jgi:hypothetical protein
MINLIDVYVSMPKEKKYYWKIAISLIIIAIVFALSIIS